METTDFDFKPAIVVREDVPFTRPRADNDEKSVSETFRDNIALCRYWKYMPASVTRKFTPSERIQRVEMLEIVKRGEECLGFSL